MKRKPRPSSKRRRPLYKAAPSAFDPCPAGKVCYKGVTLTFGGWIDLTGLYRTPRLASDTGSVYNFIPFAQSRDFATPELRFSARQSQVLGAGRCRLRLVYPSRRLR